VNSAAGPARPDECEGPGAGECLHTRLNLDGDAAPDSAGQPDPVEPLGRGELDEMQMIGAHSRPDDDAADRVSSAAQSDVCRRPTCVYRRDTWWQATWAREPAGWHHGGSLNPLDPPLAADGLPPRSQHAEGAPAPGRYGDDLCSWGHRDRDAAARHGRVNAARRGECGTAERDDRRLRGPVGD
jgi:hypothetical protein